MPWSGKVPRSELETKQDQYTKSTGPNGEEGGGEKTRPGLAEEVVITLEWTNQNEGPKKKTFIR